MLKCFNNVNNLRQPVLVLKEVKSKENERGRRNNQERPRMRLPQGSAPRKYSQELPLVSNQTNR